jgi:hypothetical protein
MTTILIIFLLIFVLGPIASAYAKRIGSSNPEAERLTGEVRALKEEVDRLQHEVHRLLEEQSFMVRMLEERTGGDGERGGRSRGAIEPPESEMP